MFARLYATHGADAHRFQRPVIEFASVVLSHTICESHQILGVKKNSGITCGLIYNPARKPYLSSRAIITKVPEAHRLVYYPTGGTKQSRRIRKPVRQSCRL